MQWFANPAHWTGTDGIPTRLVQHIQLSAESVLIGAVIALPVGVALGHYGRFGNLAINISNVGRAVPSFALLVPATLAALMAGGGFGRYIIDGLDQQDYTKLVAGAILVALLALATELGLAAAERLLVPRGIRLLRAPTARRVTYKAA